MTDAEVILKMRELVRKYETDPSGPDIEEVMLTMGEAADRMAALVTDLAGLIVQQGLDQRRVLLGRG